MSKPTKSNTEDLAFLLWEQQGRPEGRSMEGWLEAEDRKLAKAFREQENGAQREINLRSRGLGPLVQVSNEGRETEKPCLAVGTEEEVHAKAEIGVTKKPSLKSMVTCALMALGVGLVWGLFKLRKKS
jgi:hypothetical protein